MKTICFAMLLLLACGSTPQVTTGLVAGSVWGNDEETFTILADGARYDGLCLDGRVAGPIALDANGRFDVAGTLRRAGGARRDDDAPEEVRYAGVVSGDTLTLTIGPRGGAPRVTSTLRKGQHGSARPCA
jgi:hypothetical protein